MEPEGNNCVRWRYKPSVPPPADRRSSTTTAPDQAKTTEGRNGRAQPEKPSNGTERYKNEKTH
jgi:hypothetical protein